MKVFVKKRKSEKSLNEGTQSEYILVRHIEDSAKYRPKDFDSWKDYWEAKSNRKFPNQNTQCECCKETRSPSEFVGAHIEEVSNSTKRYIYPLCEVCNGKYGKGKEKSPEFKVLKSKCVPFLVDESVIVKPEE